MNEGDLILVIAFSFEPHQSPFSSFPTEYLPRICAMVISLLNGAIFGVLCPECVRISTYPVSRLN